MPEKKYKEGDRINDGWQKNDYKLLKLLGEGGFG